MSISPIRPTDPSTSLDSTSQTAHQKKHTLSWMSEALCNFVSTEASQGNIRQKDAISIENQIKHLNDLMEEGQVSPDQMLSGLNEQVGICNGLRQKVAEETGQAMLSMAFPSLSLSDDGQSSLSTPLSALGQMTKQAGDVGLLPENQLKSFTDQIQVLQKEEGSQPAGATLTRFNALIVEINQKLPPSHQFPLMGGSSSVQSKR